MKTLSRVALIAAVAAGGLVLGSLPAVLRSSQNESKPAAAPAPATSKPAGPVVFPKVGEVPKINEEGLRALLAGHNADVLVVNFWATWCGPCVAELPYFAKVSSEQNPAQVRFVGLSSDLHNQVESRVIPMLKDKAIGYPNWVLDVDPDAMISLFSDEWQGALPATFVYDRQGRKVAEHLGELKESELRALVAESLKKVRPAASGS